jgi:molybdate transport system regulatory protein
VAGLSHGLNAAVADTSLLQGRLLLAGRLDERFFALLQALHDTGSLHKAARAAGYSYKGAWLLLETAANLAHQPLVESATGGRGGGGSQLTPIAHELLAAWRELHTRHQRFLQEQEAEFLQHPALAALIRRIGMKTTARNQFAGTISEVLQGPATTQVTLDIGGGLTVTASITTAAAQRIKAKKGAEALALVKSSEVVLVSDFAGYQLSARNQMPGTIARIHQGATTSLLGLTLAGGATITASVTNDAVDALGLKVGQAATAVFKASAVMLAVAG